MGTRVGNELIVGTYIGNRICEKDIIFQKPWCFTSLNI